MKRRAFLGAAAGGVAAVAIPGVAQAAVPRPRGPIRSRPRPIGAPSSGPTPADWTALGHDLQGSLVRPGDRSYTVDSYLFDPRFDGIHPAGIAYVDNAHDIGTCLAFVRKFGIKFAARSGGHSYAGYSSSTGLIIDVENLKGVQVSGTTANVGAGTRLIDFYSELAAKGRAIPGGSCPTVGIAGLVLGGGVGVTARAYGLTCDKLASLNIITANGQALTASPSSHSDLYWACRGGGGGNFGIATWFQFNTVPAPSPVLFFLTWPWSKAAKVIAGWQSWAPNAPDALWSNLHLSAAPGGRTPTIQVGGCYLGSITGAHNLIEQLYGKVGSNATGYFLNQYSYLNAMLFKAGCKHGLTACHLPWYKERGHAHPAARVRQVGLLLQAAVERRDRHPAARRHQPAVGPGRGGRRRGSGLRRPRRPGQPGLAHRDRLRAQERPVRRPVHDRLDQRRGGGRDQQPARLAPLVLGLDAALRQRPGLPELHRPGPDQLVPGLLRPELRPAAEGQEDLRPDPPVQLPAGDRPGLPARPSPTGRAD